MSICCGEYMFFSLWSSEIINVSMKVKFHYWVLSIIKIQIFLLNFTDANHPISVCGGGALSYLEKYVYTEKYIETYV